MAEELYVTSPLARQLEAFYINRFDDQVRRLTTLVHPLTGKPLPRLPNWKACHFTHDQRNRIMDLRRVGALEEGFEARFPLNAASRYEVPPPGRREKGLYLEAVTFSRLEAHLERGYDDQPATLNDMMPLLLERSQESRDFDVAYAFALASTTGWDEGAVETITDPAKGGFRDFTILPFLVDLQSKAIHYYRGDDRLQHLVSLFDPLTRNERVVALRKRIADDLDSKGSMLDRDTVRDYQESLEMIRDAFERLAHDDERHYRIDKKHEEGWLISLLL